MDLKGEEPSFVGIMRKGKPEKGKTQTRVPKSEMVNL